MGLFTEYSPPVSRVFLDMDGVLVDFQQGACDLFKINNPYDNPKNLGKYEISDLVGIPKNLFYSAMGFDFWANLKWTKHGGDVLINILRRIGSEKSITLLSSPISTPGCLEGKASWIKSNLPRWSRRYLLGPDKWSVAGPGKLLIDDCESNVIKWIDNGGEAILMPLRSNKLHMIDPIFWLQTRLKDFSYADATGS